MLLRLNNQVHIRQYLIESSQKVLIIIIISSLYYWIIALLKQIYYYYLLYFEILPGIDENKFSIFCDNRKSGVF